MFQLAIRMDVFLRACKMASIVGIVLAIINRGDHILFGTMTFNSWIKILKTFFVPFVYQEFHQFLRLEER